MAQVKKNPGAKGWVWVLPVLLILAFVYSALSVAFSPSQIDTSEGLELLRGDTVERVVVNEGTQQVNLQLSKEYTTPARLKDQQEVPHGKDVTFTYTRAQAEGIINLINANTPKGGYNSLNPQPGFWSMLMQTVLPMVILIAGFYFLYAYLLKKSGGIGGLGNFAKARTREFNEERPNVTFADVAGEDEAVEELEEIRDFLSNPKKYTNLGARIPRGVMLYGPPGTGKTLLARAVAGEASVPFFSISGSDFVEMYAGVGASRVRDLFVRAKAAEPAIIFVDEIDAVGGARGFAMGGGGEEREQTLNQLLVEMDGFDERTSVILIAATNRPDMLDPALLRPGRFDRQIAVEAPDLKGREAILKIHAKNKPLMPDVSLAHIAKRTPGFTGADLANVLNEAALLTAREEANVIDMRAIDEAIDRVIAGPQKRTRVMNDHDKTVTAYHEGGHALCAAALNYTDPVTKVTILPRGRALGYTMVMPSEDRYSKTRNQLLDDLVYAMGGRVAEELVFIDPSTGASNDIQNATANARKMVTDYGFSDKIGNVKLGGGASDGLTGQRRGQQETPIAGPVAGTVEEEIRNLMDGATREAWEILTRNRDILDHLAKRLLEDETLLEDELKEIFKNVRKQPERPVWNYLSEAAVEGAKFGNPVVGTEEAPNQPAPQMQPEPTPEPRITPEDGQ
ncbi:cell division protein FtsH [Boudabousia liubingyangii]|uniref:ATP-dependent zinc metalloprotease FtsH n=1 Tax=Boudabousia liubingyangii TaxID=1921764 RepID=A0A1Q5PLQ8_9ACTO|nr:ATP-dependent zinc metalloprotease FtsH [Boudabousia liubingyangii]OKL46915.1 cell division protein FtsH [Boudabousia liubingyangii]OKL47976.1 cell division protein FtsH [Boudabousia liubingyangii]